MKALAVTLIGILGAAALAAQPAHSASIIMLRESFTRSSERFRGELKQAMQSAGFALEEASGKQISVRLAADAGPGSILVLPNARCFPADAKHSLEEFLKRGNHLLALSGPTFEDMVANSEGEWLTKRLSKVPLTRLRGEKIIDFREQDLARWMRASGSMGNPAIHRVESSGDSEVPDALHVELGKLDNWDVFVSPDLISPFPAGHTAMVFRAKGGPDTPELVVEWREKDRSRWMAVVTLTTEWVSYALTPDDFRYWSDSPCSGRGGPEDRFNPANAEAVSFGVANGISRQEMGIAHSYRVSDVRAVKNPFTEVDFSPPILESLSPSYKTYRTFASRAQTPGSTDVLPVSAEITAPLRRAPGFGSDAARKHRMIPVLQALDDQGEVRGLAAHLFVNAGGKYAGSVWGYVGFDQDYLEHAAEHAVPLVVSMIERVRGGVFLVNAGAEHIAYAEGEETEFGAYLANLSARPAAAQIDFSITSQGKVVHTSTTAADLSPTLAGEPRYAAGEAVTLAPGEYTVRTVLSVSGKPIDEITYPFRVISFGPLAEKDVVTVRGGDFYLDGRKWYPLGMNYWPRYVTGMEDGIWNQWQLPELYDPEIIEQDLALAQKLGMNCLSIQYARPEQGRPMMDFLARAEKRGIKIHAFMPGLHPLDQNFGLAKTLIASARIPESPAFFAYDLGWEVHVGRYDRRTVHNSAWQQWVIDRYGSIEAAQKDWRYEPQQIDGVMSGPTDEQLMTDGDWRICVAAYRRFWDDEISKRYKEVREFVRSVDMQHLMGARSGYGGTGAKWIVPAFPFDIASGAKHLDFTSPEAYGLGGDRLGFLKGGLTTLYSRFVGGGKPVFWAEYGMSIWPGSGTAEIEAARSYYENMLAMTLTSHANGSAGWWWPGGFRAGENSDYGIVNPDGTTRAAAIEIARIAPEFVTPRDVPQPDHLITIDRDEHILGYAGIYEALAQEYVRSVESGRTPGLKTRGTGTTSANVPLVAVGNVAYSGSNPPKYLNAEFNYVKINGSIVRSGGAVEVERGRPVYAEASIGNIAEATWLAPKGKAEGGVYVLAEIGGQSGGTVLAPISADTPFLADAVAPRFRLCGSLPEETVCILRMRAEGRADFGEVFRITLRPR